MRLHHRMLQRGLLAYGRISRGMTLGVRAMLLADGHVTLVKHSYMPGWYLPGGGVEAGESVGEALAREVVEEAGAVLTGPAQLFGIYRNSRADLRDHVALFVCREWEVRRPIKLPNAEIIACEAFPVISPPPDATPATLARLREVMAGAPPSTDW